MLTVSAVAAATGYSVQQVRDLERLDVIASAVRARNGYRQFSADHVRDLQAYRDLAHAVGPVEARRAMRTLRTLAPDQAAAPDVHEAIAAIRDLDDVSHSLEALDVRLNTITQRALALLRASAALARIIQTA